MTKDAENKAQQVENYDPWQDMREVFVPRRSRGEVDTLMVSVNEKQYLIPKEKRIEVPFPVYDVVNAMLEQQERTEKEMEKTSGVREIQGRW